MRYDSLRFRPWACLRTMAWECLRKEDGAGVPEEDDVSEGIMRVVGARVPTYGVRCSPMT